MSDNCPQALRPVYATKDINEPILLYEGDLEIEQGDNRLQGCGKLEFDWLPNPMVRFTFEVECGLDFQGSPSYKAKCVAVECGLDFQGSPSYKAKCVAADGSQADLQLGKKATLRSPDKSISAEVNLSGLALDPLRGITEFGGYALKPIYVGRAEDLSYILFHVVNFYDFPQRTELGDGIWKITLDRVKNAYELIQSLKQKSGFAITYVGKLERSDGQKFTGEEAVKFLDICFNFLSFASGFRVPIILLVGYDASGQKAWEYWSERIGTPWRPVISWFPKTESQALADLFPGFLRWHQDPAWSEHALFILNCHLEANLCAGMIQGSIVLVQIALESIAWIVLVKQNKTISSEGFERLSASDKLRLLLANYRIPLEIPSECQPRSHEPSLAEKIQQNEPRPKLLKYLNELNQRQNCKWTDAPYALTDFRNDVTHPRSKIPREPADLVRNAWSDAYWMYLWYLDLVLLALFQYKGHYISRLPQYRDDSTIPRQTGEPDIVPWMEPQPGFCSTGL